MSAPAENSPRYEACVAGIGAYIRERFADNARVLVIAGSGLGGFVKSVDALQRVPFSEIPHVGSSTVAGHKGELVLGEIAGTPLLLFSGRRHIYEGITPQEATLLLRGVLLSTGIRSVIISNAAGGLNPVFKIGDLMLISDQVNWMFRNPLVGRNVGDWGPRFPDLSELYSERLRTLARQVAAEARVVLREGVYLGGHGPTYETRAEVRMLRGICGADAVGMSTVPEALVCAHMGREVVGISYISNLIIEPGVTTHNEVMQNAVLVEGKFARLLAALVPRIAAA